MSPGAWPRASVRVPRRGGRCIGWGHGRHCLGSREGLGDHVGLGALGLVSGKRLCTPGVRVSLILLRSPTCCLAWPLHEQTSQAC